jgi:predicted metal-binding membrane protein
MTEITFLRKTAVAASAATAVVIVLDRLGDRTLPEAVPFGEPWVTIIGGAACWLAFVVIAHVVRWLYMAVTGRTPNLGS